MPNLLGHKVRGRGGRVIVPVNQQGAAAAEGKGKGLSVMAAQGVRHPATPGLATPARGHCRGPYGFGCARGRGGGAYLVTKRGCRPMTATAEEGRVEATWPPREPPYSYTGPGVSDLTGRSRGEDPNRGVGADVYTADRPKESAVV
jgi:hypothetical protein